MRARVGQRMNYVQHYVTHSAVCVRIGHCQHGQLYLDFDTGTTVHASQVCAIEHVGVVYYGRDEFDRDIIRDTQMTKPIAWDRLDEQAQQDIRLLEPTWSEADFNNRLWLPSRRSGHGWRWNLKEGAPWRARN